MRAAFVSNWQSWLARFILLTVGSLLGAMSVIVFMAPFDIAPSGVSGVAVILNITLGTPIGLVILLGNIPIQYLAYRRMGGWQVVAGTVYVVVLVAVAIDVFEPFFPRDGVSENVLLNALFGGIIGGVGAGLVYRAGATFGGTSTLARILQERYGTPLSTTYMYTNLGVVLVAGLVLGWEAALYSVVALALDGAASDYVLEGPSVIRTVMIVTDKPQEVSEVILSGLRRGVTAWEVTGMFTGQRRHMLYITVTRPQVRPLRQLVSSVDPGAFIIVGQGHVAYGEGFHRTKPLISG